MTPEPASLTWPVRAGKAEGKHIGLMRVTAEGEFVVLHGHQS